MSDERARREVRALHAHLAATAERPVPREASRWLGEAEAVAADAETAVAGEDVPREVVAERIGQVRELLANVDSTGDDAADEHVAAAKDLARALDEQL